MNQSSVIVIGAGPAGLTAAYLLAKAKIPVLVLEGDPTYVGGISRTEKYHNFRFDIGGHRFFSKSAEVEAFWDEILPDDMLIRPRSSRIYYRGKFFSYPLRPFEALWKLGFLESFLCVLSYGHARIFPVKEPKSFQDWVCNKFGKRLFNIFFKTYTEKVWGMSCQDISADWAAQRIKGLSLVNAVLSAFFKPRPKDRKEIVKTLINTFRYPRQGPGMMWEECTRKITKLGGNVVMGARVTQCELTDGQWSVTCEDPAGNSRSFKATDVISSTPMRTLAGLLKPDLSEKAMVAAKSLKYRDFLTVALICEHKEQFTDNWIYIHEPQVSVGRIQNFKSWSPEMVPNKNQACYGLEYFCFEGDNLWASADEKLIEQAITEMLFLGLIKDRKEVVDGCVVRQPKAYPVYDDDYTKHVDTLREELDRKFPTLHLVGRNGMHKYNNQDHSMMTAMLTAKNIIAGNKALDVWEVNEDAEYHEGGKHQADASTSGLRSVPSRVES